MSPEQALGQDDTDHRTDLWSLGVVLYEMMSGRRPFTAESYPALLPLIIEAPHPPLPASVPVEARTVVAGCLAKDRADRYPSADALLEAIERALAALLPADRAPASVFVETGRTFGTTVPGLAAEQPRATTARTARFGLAVAIFAVPVAVGVAAVASGMRRAASLPARGRGSVVDHGEHGHPPGRRDRTRLDAGSRRRHPERRLGPPLVTDGAPPGRAGLCPKPRGERRRRPSTARAFSDGPSAAKRRSPGPRAPLHDRTAPVAETRFTRKLPGAPPLTVPAPPRPRSRVTNVNNAGF